LKYVNGLAVSNLNNNRDTVNTTAYGRAYQLRRMANSRNTSSGLLVREILAEGKFTSLIADQSSPIKRE